MKKDSQPYLLGASIYLVATVFVVKPDMSQQRGKISLLLKQGSISMSGKVHSDIQTSISELTDGINNALFAIIGNAELIRLKISNADQIDDHVSSILRLTQKIAYFTTQLSSFTNMESPRD